MPVRRVCIQKPGAVIPHHSADSLTLKKSCDGVVSFSKDLEKFVLDRFYSEGIKERQEAGHGRKTWIWQILFDRFMRLYAVRILLSRPQDRVDAPNQLSLNKYTSAQIFGHRNRNNKAEFSFTAILRITKWNPLIIMHTAVAPVVWGVCVCKNPKICSPSRSLSISII